MSIDLKNIPIRFQYHSRLKSIKYLVKFDQNGDYLLIKCRNPRVRTIALKLLNKNLTQIEKSFFRTTSGVKIVDNPEITKPGVETKLRELFILQCQKLNIPPPILQIKKYRSRWGSCHNSKSISLNYYLYFLPQELIVAVICHELTHLTHPNHSQDFKALLDRYLNGQRKFLESELKRYQLGF